MTISNLLKKIKYSRRATRRGQEIAKIGSIAKTKRKDCYIKIHSITPINKGVELLAQVWDKDNKQIGFGVDGSVDIERFRFINPPLLVNDKNGNIETIHTDYKGNVIVRKLREDPKEAILQCLKYVVDDKKQKFDNSNIVTGKMGSTTTTIYPTLDGQMINNNSATWSAVHDDTDCDCVAYEADSLSINTGYQSSKYIIIRGVFLFDTSAIGGDTISSAILSLYQYGESNDNDNDGDDYVVIAASSPAANNKLVTTDFDNVGDVAFSNTRDITTDNTGYPTYRAFTLNTAGKAAIDKAGISKFSLREGHDMLNHSYGYTSQGWNNYNIRASEYGGAGTANDPKLVIEHSAVAASRSFGYIF